MNVWTSMEMQTYGKNVAKFLIYCLLQRYDFFLPSNKTHYSFKYFKILWFSQLIDEEVFCVHGGLSPDISTLDQIRVIERNQEIPYKGNPRMIIFY